MGNEKAMRFPGPVLDPSRRRVSLRILDNHHGKRMVARHASPTDLDTAAQILADAMERFLAAHPTQWFHFRGDEDR